MINLLCTFRRDDHLIGVNQEFQRDLTWWHELFQSWDGLSFFLMLQSAPLHDFQVSSDASGSLGYGAIFNTQWFFGAWSTSQKSLSIAYKELSPTVVASHLWGPQWSSRRVECLCDNVSVVAVLSPGTSREEYLMILLRYLALLAVRHSFSFTASSVRGKADPVADALSPFQFQRFRLLAPPAERSWTRISPGLLTALQVTWLRDATSSSCRALPLQLVVCPCPPSVAMLVSAIRMAMWVQIELFYLLTNDHLCVLRHP